MAESDTRSKPRRAWLVWLGLLVVLGGGAAYEWHSNAAVRTAVLAHLPGQKADPAKAAAKAPPAVPVTVVEAEKANFPVTLIGLGTVQANNTVLVRSRVDGQITKIHFEEGQIVHKGDVLIEIDPRPYKAALEQAQAKKQQDDANLANATRDLARYQSLAKSDFATRQQLDTQTSQVAQLTAQIASDQAQIDNAQVQLDYATIRAPLTGRVGFRLVDQGSIVNASSTTGIVEIAQLQPIAVVFTEPENSLPQLQAGLKAGTVPVGAYSSDGTTLIETGRLDTLNNTVDVSSGTIRIKALFDNPANKLWPGLSVVTKTTVAVLKDALVVPNSAVQRGQAGFYAYVVGSDNKVQPHDLKMGPTSDTTSVVESGLSAGDKVVTAGQYRLQPGTLVEAKAPAEHTASVEP